MQCPKCKSQDVHSQIVTGTIEEARKRHGLLWWIIIGWWWTAFKLFLFGIWWILWRVYKAISRKAKAQTFIKTAHVCNNCGYGWTTDIK